MKYALAIYWVTGCLIVGSIEAARLKHCPHDDHPVDSEDLIAVAIWPAFFTVAIGAIGADIQLPACKNP